MRTALSLKLAVRTAAAQLTYDFTVRKLLPAFELKAAQGVLVVKELKIDLDSSWSVDHLKNYALMRGNLDGVHSIYRRRISKRVTKYREIARRP